MDKFIENINIIEKDLISIFEKNRIKKIETKDKKFDPNFHQAMSEIDHDNAETVQYFKKFKQAICWVKDFTTSISRGC